MSTGPGHFRIFLDQPSAFRKIHVADFGGGIEWENGLDYAADTLKVMADEQRPVSGANLAMFESELNLSTAENCRIARLGRAYRACAYRRAKRFASVSRDRYPHHQYGNTVLAAHYRPAGHRARGRPEAKRPRLMPPDGCPPETGGPGRGAPAMPVVSDIARKPTGRGRCASSKAALSVF